MIQHEMIVPDTLPYEIKSFLGTVYELAYPRQGDTSDVAIVVCERGKYVVKRSRGGQFRDWLAQEYHVLQALIEVSLPLPRPYLYVECCTSETPEAWLVMSHLPGDSLRIVACNEADQAAKRQMLFAVGQVLAKLHSLAVPTALCAERGKAWLDSMLKQARYNLEHYEVEGSAELLEQLETQRPRMVQPTLIHGDFAIDNVLIVDREVSGIVDWAWGAWGDPRYDRALAIRPKEGIFQMPEDTQSFFNGYGTAGLSQDEYDYFVSLYEFF
ncbi:MAG TPA: phosphotransferase [Ktedonobacteraceae bacterium]|nr:phosphotransferase [Ktedonobacteraceae bacterium]